MCESEMLIVAIEKSPCLWDIHDADYHNRDVRELAWEHVCKEVVHDWKKCTDKTSRRADLKKKWTHIRDYYKKELQRMKNGGSAKKQYVYADILNFLTPIFDKTKSEENCQSDDSDNTHRQSESKEEKNIKQEDVNIRQRSRPRPLLKRKQPEKKDIPSRVLHIMQQRNKINKQPTNKDEDDDTKFLLSFRDHMKRMNVDEKIDFQMGMLQLVKKITTGSSSSRSDSEYFYFEH